MKEGVATVRWAWAIEIPHRPGVWTANWAWTRVYAEWERKRDIACDLRVGPIRKVVLPLPKRKAVKK